MPQEENNLKMEHMKIKRVLFTMSLAVACAFKEIQGHLLRGVDSIISRLLPVLPISSTRGIISKFELLYQDVVSVRTALTCVIDDSCDDQLFVLLAGHAQIYDTLQAADMSSLLQAVRDQLKVFLPRLTTHLLELKQLKEQLVLDDVNLNTATFTLVNDLTNILIFLGADAQIDKTGTGSYVVDSTAFLAAYASTVQDMSLFLKGAIGSMKVQEHIMTDV